MFVPYQSLDHMISHSPHQLPNSTNSRHYKQRSWPRLAKMTDETFVVVFLRSGDTSQAWKSLQTNWGVVQVFQLVRRMKSIRCQEFPEFIRCYETSFFGDQRTYSSSWYQKTITPLKREHHLNQTTCPFLWGGSILLILGVWMEGSMCQGKFEGPPHPHTTAHKNRSKYGKA